MKNLPLIAFLLLSMIPGYGQKITERLILTDTKDSIYLKAKSKVFDREGNYCFSVKPNDREFFITNKDTIAGDFKFIGSTYGNGGEINYTQSYNDPLEKPFYYKNGDGTQIYGPVKGKLGEYQTSNTKEHVGITTTSTDSIFYHIDGKTVAKNYLSASDKSSYIDRGWVAFSENGNVIYSIRRNGNYILYVNHLPIDSSAFEYYQLAINNEGEYIYAEGQKPSPPIEKYNYLFYIHSSDSVLGYVRTVWEYDLKESGSYYYSGDDNGPSYIAINNNLHKGLYSISNITLLEQNYLFSSLRNDSTRITVNGKTFLTDLQEIIKPTLDNNGNFAFYGIKDYYLYKYVNNVKEKVPLSKYNVRAQPVYLSPKGESLHYFKTDDSIYVYQDEKLLFPALSKKEQFIVQPGKDLLNERFVRGEAQNGNSLFYLQYKNDGYLVYNGKFSKPIIPAQKSSYYNEKDIGEIIIGETNDYGYFVIQKTSEKQYLLIVNNEIYHELNDIDLILSDGYFFTNESLIFYGVKNSSFYQFKLSL